MNKLIFLFFLNIFAITCNNKVEKATERTVEISEIEVETKDVSEVESMKPIQEIPLTLDASKIQTGTEQMEKYLPHLKGKKVALVVNQTSTIGDIHLADVLVKKGIDVVKIFAPEHGFRGTADAGEHVKNGKDISTGAPLISLYGKRKKPLPEDLKDVDLVVFDIQDVGARFYTYISTMTYVMEACAEQNIQFMVLDRPNPNGHYVDGPVLKKGFESFVGLHPIPVVHGMTVGEYAQMVNGEGWLKNGVKCDLKVIKNANYNHEMIYKLPIKPSPNLPNSRAIYLYPSLCFFEGTQANVGRGTNHQFQIIGAPNYGTGRPGYTFTPTSQEGAKHPKHEGKECYGFDLLNIDLNDLRNKRQINLSYLIDFYNNYRDKENFFLENNFIDKLAGTDALRLGIIEGKTEEELRKEWEEDLIEFKSVRAKYLLY